LKLLFFLNLALSGLSVLAFGSLLISPERFWYFSVVGLLTLPCLLVQGLFFVFWLWQKWRYAWLPLLTLLLGWPMLRATLPINFGGASAGMEKPSFVLLSYNLTNFNVYGDAKGKSEGTKQLIDYIAAHHAEIKCFQEFYDQKGHATFDISKRMKTAGYPNRAVCAMLTNRIQAEFGLAVYSKWPIEQWAELDLGATGVNGAMYADVATPNGTVRVINFHLQSLHLSSTDLAFNKENYKNKSKGLLKVFRHVTPIHTRQIRLLIEAVEASPHPVILCGDLNETPYSYGYRQLNKRLQNAHEAAGSGFGFTLNRNKLFFLRIDHQFYADELAAVYALVDRKAALSDHFPLEVGYRWEEAPSSSPGQAAIFSASPLQK